MSLNRIALGLLLTISLAASSSRGQSTQPATPDSKLAAARIKYESGMADLRKQVLKGIDAREQAQRSRASIDAAELEKIKQERTAFAEAGTLPASAANAKALIKQQRKQLLDAYKAAANQARSSKLKQDDLATALDAEATSITGENDLAAWSDDRLAANAQRKLTAGSEPGFQQTLDVDQSYRLELLAQTDAGTTLNLEIPTPKKTRVTVPVSCANGGSVRVLLAVRDAAVSPELGVDHPVAPFASSDNDAAELQIKVLSGSVTLKSLKTKPILAAGEEDAPAKTKEVAAAEDPYRAGRTWHGEWKGNQKAIKIASRNGDHVVFHFEGSTAGALWEASGTLQRGTVTFNAGDRIRNPPGRQSVSLREVGGGARIAADGTLNFRFIARLFGDGAPANTAIDFVIPTASPD